MKWLKHWLPGPPLSDMHHTKLTPTITEQLHQWQALPSPDLTANHIDSRYTVVNTEATSLNLTESRLLSVAAITIEAGQISPLASYYAPLADAPEQALADLLTFCGKNPLIVFSDINRTMLADAVNEALGIDLTRQPCFWLDLYTLLPALFPERIERSTYLRNWMISFGMETFLRHHALGDAWVIAQLFLAVQGKAQIKGINTPQALAELERHRHKMKRHI